MVTPRQIPEDLYGEVFALVSEIVQPLSDPLDRVDGSVSRIAYFKLEALYKNREERNAPDPFLTETLADFTEDAAEAIRLYRLSLTQAEAFPGEILRTKRVGLARRLLEIDAQGQAREQLGLARSEALAVRDTDLVDELEELSAQLSE